MSFAVSLLLIAIGAILTWAVNATVSGIDINTVGVILMVVGLAGGLISLVLFGSGYRSRRSRVYEDDLP